MECGYRDWGHDVSDEDTPLEAGLGFTIAWDKKIPFIGREALLRGTWQARRRAAWCNLRSPGTAA